MIKTKYFLNVKLTKIFLVSLFYFNFSSSISAQDIHFSQLSQTQFFSNPAFAGIQFGPRILAQYRSQYPAVGSQFNSSFNSYYLSYDQFFNPYNSGLGGQIIVDKLGDNIFSRYYLNLNYAYQAKFNEFQAIRFGLSGNFTSQQLDRSKLIFYDQIDPVNGYLNPPATNENLTDNYTQTNLNINAGIVYFQQNFYVGASARNLLSKSNFYNSNKKSMEDLAISGQAGGVYWLNIDKKIAIFPYLLYERQYQNQKIVANVLYQYEMINLGMGARHDSKNLESIMVLAGFNFKKLRISYSYDINTNEMSAYSSGSHELGIRILFGGEDNSLHPNEYKDISFCPNFMKN